MEHYTIMYRSGVQSGPLSANSDSEAFAIECREAGTEAHLSPSWSGGNWDVVITCGEREMFYQIIKEGDDPSPGMG